MMPYAIMRRRIAAKSSAEGSSLESEPVMNSRESKRLSALSPERMYSLYLPKRFWYDDSRNAFSWLLNWKMKTTRVSVITTVCTIVATTVGSVMPAKANACRARRIHPFVRRFEGLLSSTAWGSLRLRGQVADEAVLNPKLPLNSMDRSWGASLFLPCLKIKEHYVGERVYAMSLDLVCRMLPQK